MFCLQISGLFKVMSQHFNQIQIQTLTWPLWSAVMFVFPKIFISILLNVMRMSESLTLDLTETDFNALDNGLSYALQLESLNHS